jgi:hypothetical protein
MNREEAKQRIDEIASRLGWDHDRRREFHDYMHEYHWDVKDEWEFAEVWEIAQEFDEDN